MYSMIIMLIEENNGEMYGYNKMMAFSATVHWE